MRRKTLIIAIAFGLSHSAGAATFIRCTNANKDAVTITLDSMRKFSSSLNCIEGKFISDMTPCAPNGGFGLSAPTGAGLLVGVVQHWQDYTKHSGGVTGSRVDGSTIWFNGGVMVLEQAFHQAWSFSVHRLTGDAILTTFKDDLLQTKAGTVAYKCSAITQKF